MLILGNPVRAYAWGSERRLARFLGREPAGGPEAELWIGAHADDPSLLPDGRRLDAVIAADSVSMLGDRVASVHAGRLPFMMKVLAVDRPLSLQVHPRAAQATAGFAREDGAGVPDAERNYRDPFHKPELLYALTRFEGMAGFRDVAATASILQLLGHPWADALAADLGAAPAAEALERAVTRILAMHPRDVSRVLEELVASAAGAVTRGHRRQRSTRLAGPRDPEWHRESIRVFELLPSLAGRYPEDPGVLTTLLLNHLVLAPGEAMFVAPGVLHAYVSGTGVEVMAASDNVVRAGLTTKHRDVAELLRLTDFAPVPPLRCEPTVADGVRSYSPPVADFALHVADAPCQLQTADGPSIVLALEDSELIAEQPATLPRGTSVYLPPSPRPLQITRGSVAQGSVPS